MNHRRFAITLFFAAACSLSAQTIAPGPPLDESAIWRTQPLLRFDDGPALRPTVPKEMIASLRLSDVNVPLEHIELQALQIRFGGKIGEEGDASNWHAWLCLHGSDTVSPWVLWLESSEIDGPYVGGFELRRVSRSAQFDERCAALPDTARIEMPIDLSLGTSKTKVISLLGRPTARVGDVLLYEHEHNELIRGEEFTSDNNVTVELRNGVVSAIDVTKTTQD
jgi:hypothetical protein